MLYAVFDTNWVKSAKSFDHLLGSITNLKAISEYATIVIPKMVLDEVLEDKRRTFFDAVKSVNNSPIREVMELPTIEDYDERWQSIEEGLVNDQSIPFRCLDIRDVGTAFEEACRLAINHKPPFEERSDKGFKDFVICWTIKELIAEKPDDRVVVLTNDQRLQEYIRLNLKAEIAESLAEFMQLAQPLQVGTHEQGDVAAMPAENSSSDEEQHVGADFANLVMKLESANSFSAVRSLMTMLEQKRNELTSDEKVTLLRAALNNSQVKWALLDRGIEHFFLPLFAEYGDELDVRKADELAASFRKESLLIQCADMATEKSVSEAYSVFARKLEKSLISVDPEAYVESLSYTVLPRLKAVLADNSLDKRIPYGGDVYECFIEQDKFECMSWGFDFDALELFVKTMEQCGWRERFLSFREIASHIREKQDVARN